MRGTADGIVCFRACVSLALDKTATHLVAFNQRRAKYTNYEALFFSFFSPFPPLLSLSALYLAVF
jgi:hypothetical protein